MVHSVGHRTRLYDLIIGGFEYLLQRSSGDSQRQKQTNRTIDGRGAGYVVWVPSEEQFQQQWERWDEESEHGGSEEGCGPVVAYGGGYGGLFNVRATAYR